MLKYDYSLRRFCTCIKLNHIGTANFSGEKFTYFEYDSASKTVEKVVASFMKVSSQMN